MRGHKRKVLFVAAVFTTMAAMGTTGLGSANAAVGPAGSRVGPHPDLLLTRDATERFHDVDAAQGSGYTAVVADLSGATCIDEPGAGAMGIHYLNPGLLDASVDVAEPEVIVYEPGRDGSLGLVAVEYLTFKADWEAAGNTGRPVLFGQTFDLVEEPNRYGIPDFYALHAWIWKRNPSGMFAMYNPKVKCGRDLSIPRNTTAAYHDVGAAESDGYTAVVADLSGATCIDEPGQGAMGVHHLNPDLLDGAVDPAAPEVIVYEPRRDGSLKLVAVEYLTFKADWEAAGNTEPPVLFGQTFDLVEEPNRYGIPDFYALHAWIWKSNPSGIFAMWNPQVRCIQR